MQDKINETYKEKEENNVKIAMLHEKIVKLENESRKLYETELEKMSQKLEAANQEALHYKNAYSTLSKKYEKMQKQILEQNEIQKRKIIELEAEVATARTYAGTMRPENERYSKGFDESVNEKCEWEDKYNTMSKEIEMLQKSIKTLTKIREKKP